MLNRIPLEEQRVIDELVEFWQNRSEPPDLVTHIYKLSGVWGSGIGADFIRQVYKNVRTGDNLHNYASASEFKRFLEAVYNKQALEAALEEEERKERIMRARAKWTNSKYINRCWSCHQPISSDRHTQCPKCKYYYCGNCGACLCGSLRS